MDSLEVQSPQVRTPALYFHSVWKGKIVERQDGPAEGTALTDGQEKHEAFIQALKAQCVPGTVPNLGNSAVKRGLKKNLRELTLQWGKTDNKPGKKVKYTEC